MPVKVKWLWLNDGEEITLPDLPIKGQEEILELARKQVDYEALLTRIREVHLAQVITITKKILDKYGVEKTKQAFDATIQSKFPDLVLQLTWQPEEFKENLDSWVDSFLLRRNHYKDVAEAEVKLEERATLLGKEVDEMRKKGTDFALVRIHTQMLEVYWRLKNSPHRAFKGPSGAFSLSFKRDDRAADLDALKEVVTDDDLAQMHPKRDAKPLDMEDLYGKSSEVVLGNSNPTPPVLSESAPSSTPSSESVTAPANESKTPEA